MNQLDLLNMEEKNASETSYFELFDCYFIIHRSFQCVQTMGLNIWCQLLYVLIGHEGDANELTIFCATDS